MENNYRAIIEAILFTMGESVELSKIAEVIELDKKETKAIIEEMMEEWNASDRGVSIIELDGAYQMCTKTEMYDSLVRIAHIPKKQVLTDVLLETLSIIAYKQPVTRLDLEEIRGNSEYAIQNLLKLGVIEVVGRKEAVGRPVLFGTTDEFLKRFQFSSLDELPDYNELMARIKMANGTNESYLYRKDEYVEGDEDHKKREIDLSNIKTRGEVMESAQQEFELPDITEDLPDFLQGEDVAFISGDDMSFDESDDNED